MHRFRHRHVIIVLLLVLIGSVLLFSLFHMNRQTTLPQGANMSVVGVELDQDKDFVDLDQLQKNGIKFVYLRGTQGKSYFDDNYLLYRDQMQGTHLSFGTIVSFSNESSVEAQYHYFESKIGQNTGELPVLIVPAVLSQSHRYWRQMTQFVQLLEQNGKSVCVMGDYRWHTLFSKQTKFMYTGASLKDKTHYAFWCYTQNGNVAHVDQLDRHDVTMFAYIGSLTTYEQLYEPDME